MVFRRVALGEEAWAHHLDEVHIDVDLDGGARGVVAMAQRVGDGLAHGLLGISEISRRCIPGSPNMNLRLMLDTAKNSALLSGWISGRPSCWRFGLGRAEARCEVRVGDGLALAMSRHLLAIEAYRWLVSVCHGQFNLVEQAFLCRCSVFSHGRLNSHEPISKMKCVYPRKSSTIFLENKVSPLQIRILGYGRIWNREASSYRPRLVDERLQRLLSTFGAVEIRGTKWCGKSWAALAFGESVVHLDDP